MEEHESLHVEVASLKSTVNSLSDNVNKLTRVVDILQNTVTGLAATRGTIDWKSIIIIVAFIGTSFAFFMAPERVRLNHIHEENISQHLLIEKLFEKDQATVIEQAKQEVHIEYLKRGILADSPD